MELETLLGGPVPVFIGLTVVLVGGAAWLTGRAIALTWRPIGQVLWACLGLALAARFLTFALFDGPLLSLPGFVVAYLVLTGIALLAYRVTLVARMVRQYPWRYRRVSLFAYVEIEGDGRSGG
jgi:hypothetical protein